MYKTIVVTLLFVIVGFQNEILAALLMPDPIFVGAISEYALSWWIRIAIIAVSLTIVLLVRRVVLRWGTLSLTFVLTFLSGAWIVIPGHTPVQARVETVVAGVPIFRCAASDPLVLFENPSGYQRADAVIVDGLSCRGARSWRSLLEQYAFVD